MMLRCVGWLLLNNQGGNDNSSATSVTVSFPVAFNSACLSAYAYDVNNTMAARYFVTSTTSKTDAVFIANNSPESFRWFAFGS